MRRRLRIVRKKKKSGMRVIGGRDIKHHNIPSHFNEFTEAMSSIYQSDKPSELLKEEKDDLQNYWRIDKNFEASDY